MSACVRQLHKPTRGTDCEALCQLHWRFQHATAKASGMGASPGKILMSTQNLLQNAVALQKNTSRRPVSSHGAVACRSRSAVFSRRARAQLPTPPESHARPTCPRLLQCKYVQYVHRRCSNTRSIYKAAVPQILECGCTRSCSLASGFRSCVCTIGLRLSHIERIKCRRCRCNRRCLSFEAIGGRHVRGRCWSGGRGPHCSKGFSRSWRSRRGRCDPARVCPW